MGMGVAIMAVLLAIVTMFFAVVAMGAVVIHARGVEARSRCIFGMSVGAFAVGMRRAVLVGVGLTVLGCRALPVTTATGRQGEAEHSNEQERRSVLKEAFHDVGRVVE